MKHIATNNVGIYANLQPICKPIGLPLQRKNKKIWHTNITIIITMKTRRHARAARISTNIITITTTTMKKGITTTITTME